MLTEIVKDKGIYSFKKTLVRGNTVSPVLAVHPYYRIPNLRNVDESYKDYLTNLERLIRTYDEPLITLEEISKVKRTAGKLKRTARRYHNLGRKENALFIETEPDDPEPNEDKMSWEECLEFLKQFNDPFLLAGGRLWGKYGGCLGGTIEKLEEAEIKYEVLKEITFS